MKKVYNKRGAIAVFLTMVLISHFTLIGVFAEAAAGKCARSIGGGLLDLAALSVLSEYNRYLQEDYGLFGLELSEEGIEDRLTAYMEANLAKGKTGKDLSHLWEDRPSKFGFESAAYESEGIDPLRLGVSDVKVDISALSLLNKDLLEAQILSFMKYRIVKALPGLNELFDDAFKAFEGVVSTGYVEDVFGSYDKTVKQLEKAETQWETVKALEDKLSGMDSDSESYAELLSELKSERNRLDKILDKMKGTLPDVKKKLNDCTDHTSGGASGLSNITQDLEETIKELEGLNSGNAEAFFTKNQAADGQKEKGKEVKKQINDILSSLNDDGINDLIENGPSGSGSRVLKNKGIINSLPSRLLDQPRYGLPDLIKKGNLSELLLTGRDALYLNEYIMLMFKNHLDDKNGKDTFFDHEVEYILWGELSDKKNLNKTKNYLIGIRTSLNLIHIYSDAEKRNQVMLLASAIAPGPFALALQFLIAGAWAAAEAINDVNLMLKGKKVPLFKTKDTWALSLDGALKGEKSEKGFDKGIGYEDYLRILLFLKSKESRLIGIMDLIQINLKGSYDGSFLISKCSVGFDASAVLSRERGFFDITGRREGEIDALYVY